MSTSNRYAGEKKGFQTPEESLHWISYNLKKLNEEIKGVAVALERIRLLLESKQEPRSDKLDF